MSTITAVFVYGTLKQGQGNYHIACQAGQHTVTPAILDGHQLHDLGPFPAVVRGEGTVHGQLLDYGEGINQALKGLDMLEGFRGEGHPANLYNRVQATVISLGGKPVSCWVYVYARPLARPRHLPAGHWPLSSGAL